MYRVSQYTWGLCVCPIISAHSEYIYIYRERVCLYIHETQMAADNSTANNIVFFFVSDFKIVYYNNF